MLNLLAICEGAPPNLPGPVSPVGLRLGLRGAGWVGCWQRLARRASERSQGRAGTLAYLGRVAGLVGAFKGLRRALADSAREWAICFFRLPWHRLDLVPVIQLASFGCSSLAG